MTTDLARAWEQEETIRLRGRKMEAVPWLHRVLCMAMIAFNPSNRASAVQHPPRFAWMANSSAVTPWCRTRRSWVLQFSTWGHGFRCQWFTNTLTVSTTSFLCLWTVAWPYYFKEFVLDFFALVSSYSLSMFIHTASKVGSCTCRHGTCESVWRCSTMWSVELTYPENLLFDVS